MQIAPVNISNQTNFGHGGNDNAPKSLKKKVFLTSLAAVGVTTAIIAKKQGFSLNLKKIFNTNPKDWAIFKFYNKKKPNEKFIEYETPQILALGGASVAGGFLGGALFDDKKNMKAKARESLNQLVGNVLVPIGVVGTAGKYYAGKKSYYKKYNGLRLKEVVERAMPQFKVSNTLPKLVNGINSLIRAVPTIGVTAVALGIGIVGGNKVSNFINEKIYKRKIERDVKVSDFAPHLDDVCYAASMMAPKVSLFSAIARAVPMALVVPGLQVGSAQEHSNKVS